MYTFSKEVVYGSAIQFTGGDTQEECDQFVIGCRQRCPIQSQKGFSTFITQTEGTAETNDGSLVHVQNSRFGKKFWGSFHSAP